MDTVALCLLPERLRDDVIRKMTITSFTNLRRTCKFLNNHLLEKRTRFSIRYGVDIVELKREKIFIGKNHEVIKTTFQPSEFAGLVAEKFLVSYDESLVLWYTKFLKMLKAQPIECRFLHAIAFPKFLLNDLLCCFQNCEKIMLHSGINESFSTNLFNSITIQKSKKLTIALMDSSSLTLIPRKFEEIDIATNDCCTVGDLYAFLEELQKGSRTIEVIRIFCDLDEMGLKKRMNELSLLLPLSTVWSTETHAQSDLKDYSINKLLRSHGTSVFVELISEDGSFYGISASTSHFTVKKYTSYLMFLNEIVKKLDT